MTWIIYQNQSEIQNPLEISKKGVNWVILNIPRDFYSSHLYYSTQWHFILYELYSNLSLEYIAVLVYVVFLVQ